jgi:hypothetical protein
VVELVEPRIEGLVCCVSPRAKIPAVHIAVSGECEVKTAAVQIKMSLPRHSRHDCMTSGHVFGFDLVNRKSTKNKSGNGNRDR